ncbi:hypothetical protein F5X99DRAFT_298359 [Biscogniauxia marginata]|nr:hypothetical protein F5X99DRAFT_298359 [Biscogniauxia marginata]
MAKDGRGAKKPKGLPPVPANATNNPTAFITLNGFVFPQYPLQGIAVAALETPFEGVDSIKLTRREYLAICGYQNAFSLLTAALEAKDLWTNKSDNEGFIAAVDMRWRLAIPTVTRFLIHFLLNARQKYHNRHLEQTSTPYPITALA